MIKSPYCRHSWYSRNILQWNKNKTKSTKITQWRLLCLFHTRYNSHEFRLLVNKVNFILVEMESADKDKTKNCELLGELKN